MSQLENKDGVKQFYPQLVRREVVETEDVAQMLAVRSAMTPGDTHSIMRNLSPVFKELLMDGKSINIEGLGTFTVWCKSKYGVDTPEEVNANQIKSLRVVFTPAGSRSPMEGTTRSMFSGVKFKKLENVTGTSQGGDNPGSDDENEDDPTA